MAVANPDLDARTHTNWASEILPYAEQQALYAQYMAATRNNGPGLPNLEYDDSPVNQPFVQRFVNVYTCPTDPNKNKILAPASKASASPANMQFATATYRAVAGLATPNNYYWDTIQLANPPPANYRGAIHIQSQSVGLKGEKIVAIQDGTSTTLMFGEYMTTTSPDRCTFWARAYTSYSMSVMHASQPRTLIADYDACAAIPGPNNANPCKRGWGSLHGGGAINFAARDGSVRTIAQTIDTVTLFPALGTIANGEVSNDQ